MLGLQPDYLLRLSRRTTVVFAFSPSTPQSNAFRRRSQLLIVTAHQAEPNFRNASICDGEVTLWVKRVGFVMSAVCPVYPKQQTFPDPVGTSHLGQTRKSSLHSITSSARPVTTHAPRSDRPFGIHQDGFARFRKTISWARSTKARKLAAMWRRPG